MLVGLGGEASQAAARCWVVPLRCDARGEVEEWLSEAVANARAAAGGWVKCG